MKAEEASREREEMLRAMSANIPGSLFRKIQHPGGQVTYPFLSTGTADLLEVDMNRLARKPELIVQHVHPYDRALYETAYARSAETMEPLTMEYRRVVPSDKEKWVRTIARPHRTDDGSVVWDGVALDISERKRAEEDLRRLAAAIEELDVYFGLYDAEDRLVLCNQNNRDLNQPVVETLTPGVTFEEHVRATIAKGLVPDAVGREEEWLRQRLERHRNPRHPFEYRRQDGIWLLMHEQRLPDGSTITIGTDITEPKNVEEALRESEERFRNLIAGSTQGIMIHRDFQPLFLNSPYAEIFGFDSPDEVLALDSVLELAPPHVQARAEVYAAAPLRGDDAPTDYEYDGLRKDGSTIWLDNSVRVISWKGEQAIQSTVVDVTERKHAEDALRRSEETYRSIIETTSEGYIETDSEARLTRVNNSFCRMLGYQRQELLGQSIFFLVDGESVKIVKAQLRARRRQGHRIYDLEFKTKDGRRLTTTVHATTLKDQNGEVTGGFAFVSDITDAVNAHSELKKAQERAETANRAKSDFLANMSHDLRTPMNAILGFGQLLLLHPDEALSDVQRDYVENILQSGWHLLELISQVLELSKIEAGKVDISITKVGSGDILDESLSLIQAEATGRNIAIVREYAPRELPYLWTDGTRLKQVLVNLLSNAVKYNRTGGKIIVRCETTSDDMFHISVTDTGSGIPAAMHDQVFEPFTRLGRERGSVEGTGIGLTVTKQLVELLDGRIDFVSEEDVGSTFWVEIPLQEKKDLETRKLELVVERGRNQKKEGPVPRTILYVEDNPSNVRLMDEVMQHLPGTDVTLLIAYDAGRGVEAAKKRKPDLILMDLNLPGMDGFEALKHLRRSKKTRHIPVIALTADALPHQIEKGLKAGFHAYVTKPVNVTEVRNVISDAIDIVRTSDVGENV